MKLGIVLSGSLAGPVFVLAFPEENGEIACHAPLTLPGTGVVVGRSALWFDLIGPQACLAEQAVAHGIGESSHVARGGEDGLVGQDRAIEADDVLPFLHVPAPPVFLEIALHLHAKRTVVPASIEAAVEFGRLIDEAPSLAERHDLLHALRISVFFVSHGLAGCGGPRWKRPAGGLARNWGAWQEMGDGMKADHGGSVPGSGEAATVGP